MDKYDIPSYEQEFLEKYDNEQEFTESELKEWTWNDYERIEGENRRWSRSVTSIIHVGDRFFAIDWEEGLTEMQENDGYCQPYEVKKVEKQIIVTEWESV